MQILKKTTSVKTVSQKMQNRKHKIQYWVQNTLPTIECGPNLRLKFAGVPQTPEPISAASGPEFTIL